MPKIVEKFVYIELPGAVYILHTREPFVIGRVWLYKSLPALQEQLEKLQPLSYAQMELYAIAITMRAVLGDRMIAHAGTKEELQRIMNGMLDFYKETRLEKSIRWHEKFKI